MVRARVVIIAYSIIFGFQQYFQHNNGLQNLQKRKKWLSAHVSVGPTKWKQKKRAGEHVFKNL